MAKRKTPQGRKRTTKKRGAATSKKTQKRPQKQEPRRFRRLRLINDPDSGSRISLEQHTGYEQADLSGSNPVPPRRIVDAQHPAPTPPPYASMGPGDQSRFYLEYNTLPPPVTPTSSVLLEMRVDADTVSRSTIIVRPLGRLLYGALYHVDVTFEGRNNVTGQYAVSIVVTWSDEDGVLTTDPAYSVTMS